jgi:hypothetical protein
MHTRRGVSPSKRETQTQFTALGLAIQTSKDALPNKEQKEWELEKARQKDIEIGVILRSSTDNLSLLQERNSTSTVYANEWPPAYPNSSLRMYASPSRVTQLSPSRLSQSSPGRLTQTSPGRIIQTSPGRVSYISPGRMSGTSPVRVISPARATGPGRESSHGILRETYHTTEMSSPRKIEGSLSPGAVYEPSPGVVRVREGSLSPVVVYEATTGAGVRVRRTESPASPRRDALRQSMSSPQHNMSPRQASPRVVQVCVCV